MKKLYVIVIVFFCVKLNAQRKYFADRYFNEFAYSKSAELFENIFKKGDSTAHVISRIGDSYYNNAQYEKAEEWYQKLLSVPNDTLSTEYYFKYAQTLKSIGKVEESDKWMLKFRDVKNQDSRPQELLENRDYFVEYTNKKSVFINIHNLSTNTEYSDFGGFIFDDKLFFASSKPLNIKSQKIYKWNNQPFLNIYEANQINQSETNQFIDLADPDKFDIVNSKYHESNIIFTNDGNTIYFTRVNYNGKNLGKDEENTVNLKIYRSKKVDDKWTQEVELPFNSDEYSVGHPALSLDEKTLYFVSDMPGSIGQTDLYKVNISDDHNTYSEPVNLGSTINTEGKEMFPYIGHNNTLYFSSNGLLGLGALDVFESKIENGSFSEPVNLGVPVNSPMDDFAFVINKDLTNGYFSSNRAEGKGDDDIYSFILYEVEEPKEPEVCYESIAGIVRDKRTNEVLPNAKVRLLNEKGELIKETVSKDDGSYTFENINCAISTFTLNGNKIDYRPDRKSVKTTALKDNIAEADLYLTPLIVGNQIVIKPIYFDFDKYYIRQDAAYELENIVDVMNNHPEMIIKIESHTDSRGSNSYNRILSDRRAKSTRDHIISRGIAANRIQSAIGYGEDQLLNHCNDANRYKCSEEEHQLNRRSYFYIVKGAPNVNVIEQQE